MTSNIRWMLDPKPDSVDYLGHKVEKIAVSLGKAQTDAAGAFSMTVKTPVDFGGLRRLRRRQRHSGGEGWAPDPPHRDDEPQEGDPSARRSPSRSWAWAPTYESLGAVLYDNKFTGTVSGNMTRGATVFKMRAAGEPRAPLDRLRGLEPQRPLPQPRTVPDPLGCRSPMKFTVTKGAANLAPKTEWPVKVKPTIEARTTLLAANLASDSKATARLSAAAGFVLSKTTIRAAGLTPSAPVDLVWSTVVGNRVNCTGTCWSFVPVPLGRATSGADGTLSSQITVPDGLGGWHVVQLIQAGKVMAQVPYFVKRNFIKAPKVVKAGQPFIVELKGVGWTQLDNTTAVTYDNAYIGYACGFNSNGYVRIQLFATGKPGVHLIDLYPLLYTQQPAYPYLQLGMVPFLSYRTDWPGLAAGYQVGLPARDQGSQVGVLTGLGEGFRRAPLSASPGVTARRTRPAPRGRATTSCRARAPSSAPAAAPRERRSHR